jgi:hypothetical protein
MKEFNIREFNRLCAELLGFKCLANGQYELPEMMTFGAKICLEDMQYHSDWNWIMSVVEKIVSLDIVEDFEYWYDKENKIHSCSIIFDKLPVTKTSRIATRSKESMKEAYVKAIWWFFDIRNKNKSIS